MYFMEIDELDEVNSNISNEDIHDYFQELYEDLEVTYIKVAYKGHRNSRSQRLDQATFGGAQKVIDDI